MGLCAGLVAGRPCTDIFVEDIAAVFHPEAFEGHEFTKLVKLPMN